MRDRGRCPEVCPTVPAVAGLTDADDLLLLQKPTALFGKDLEREHLDYFLSARRYATGGELTLVTDSEAPDFVCKRPSGELVGVEHTRIEYNPERTEILHACRAYDGELDNFAVFGLLRDLANKESKRGKPHWKYPDATILVLDLPEGYRFEAWPEDSSRFDGRCLSILNRLPLTSVLPEQSANRETNFSQSIPRQRQSLTARP